MAFFCKRKLRFALIGTLALVGAGTFLSTCTTRSKAAPIPGDASTYTTQKSTIPDVDLDKCPITRSNFDALKMGMAEHQMFDVMPCIEGTVVMESDEGYHRHPIPVRMWKFPRAGGGFLYVVTTNYQVSGKRWE